MRRHGRQQRHGCRARQQTPAHLAPPGCTWPSFLQALGKSRLYAVRGNTFALRRIELYRSCVVSVTALAEGPTIELVSREQSWVGGVQATKLASVSGEHFLVHAPLQYYYWQRREVCASRDRALPRNPSEFSGQAPLGHPRLRPSE